jgi:hypothetical protein
MYFTISVDEMHTKNVEKSSALQTGHVAVAEMNNDIYRTYIPPVAQWLRLCATNRKVAVSITDCFIGFFRWHNPSNRTMALGPTQPQT